MAFVNKQGGEQQQDKAAAGQPIDFDPDDASIVKVHYDMSAWSFDHRAELAEALADAEIPHYWDDDELVVPEVVEEAADAMFERLEAELGPFPVGLGDEASVEYGLDEWSDTDRSTLTEALVDAEIPHRWEGTAILVAREELGFRCDLQSDLAPLHATVQDLIAAGLELHCLRDLTRGGLASASDEIARSAGCTIEIDEEAVPLQPEVRSACELLGLDPLAMANEGRMLVICPASEADAAMALLQQHNPSATRVGAVTHELSTMQRQPVVVRNRLGVLRPLDLGRGEQLPRIC